MAARHVIVAADQDTLKGDMVSGKSAKDGSKAFLIRGIAKSACSKDALGSSRG